MQRVSRVAMSTSARVLTSGNPGSGVGLGGGGGGTIRSAGGAFGKLEAAREEEYFYKLQRAQLKNLKEQLHREIEHHEKQLKNHEQVVQRHKKRIAELEHEERNISN